ncbi:hypothetical protein NG55_15275 [Acinetobacter gyllenbergii]|nr:hypothetical protein NG55_15275 [Acinetobacter gyllenbergii]
MFIFDQLECNFYQKGGILEYNLICVFRCFMDGMCQKNQSKPENMLGFLPQMKSKNKQILDVIVR